LNPSALFRVASAARSRPNSPVRDMGGTAMVWTCSLNAVWVRVSPARYPGANVRLATAALAAAAVLSNPAPVIAASPEVAAKPEASSNTFATTKAQPTTGNLVGHGGPVKALAVSEDGRQVLSGSFDYAMILWLIAEPGTVVDSTPPKPPEGTLAARLDPLEGAVNAVAFRPESAGGDLLAAGDDASLWQFSRSADKTPLKRMQGHTAKIVGLDISADGARAATASWDRTARLWDLANGEPGPVLEGHQGPVNAAVFSADADQVFTAGYDGAVRRFDVATGALDRPIHKHGWGINALVRLNDRDLLAFGALDGSVGLLDGRSGDVIKKLAQHDKPVLALAVSTSHGLLATAGGDGKIRVWSNDADGFSGSWALKEEYENPYGPIWALAFSGDGTALYYGGLDDIVHRWTITPRQPFETVESAYPRRFQISGNPNDPVALGEIQFARKCSVCHTLEPDGRKRAGPTLHNIFGRRIASLPGYNFSEALKKLDIVWTEETVSRLFEVGPDKFTPGSKMPLQKMTDARQRDALIAFLRIATSGEGANTQTDEKTKPGKGSTQ